jgi:hypothetical protein
MPTKVDVRAQSQMHTYNDNKNCVTFSITGMRIPTQALYMLLQLFEATKDTYHGSCAWDEVRERELKGNSQNI